MRKRLLFVLVVVGTTSLGAPSVTSASMSQPSLNFGTVHRSVVKNVIYGNTTGVDQAGFALLGNGAQATDPFFFNGDGCTGTMLAAGGGGCGIGVRFDASTVHPGHYSSTLTVRIMDVHGHTSTESIPLSGTAVAVASPYVSGASVTPSRYAPVGPSGARGDAVFTFTAGQTRMAGWPRDGALIAVSIHSTKGALVRRWWIHVPAPSTGGISELLAPFTQVWNGTDSHGHVVSAGVYSFRASVYVRGHLVRSKPQLITVVR